MTSDGYACFDKGIQDFASGGVLLAMAAMVLGKVSGS